MGAAYPIAPDMAPGGLAGSRGFAVSAGVSAIPGIMRSMAQNVGIAPPDKTTDIGRMRLALGDSKFTEITDNPGHGEYQLFSDDELQVFLDISGDNVARAIAMAYQKIGASWASIEASVRTDDLSLTAKDSVGNWLNLAAYWNKLADDQDARGVSDHFNLVTIRRVDGRARSPEASPHRLDVWDGGYPW